MRNAQSQPLVFVVSISALLTVIASASASTDSCAYGKATIDALKERIQEVKTKIGSMEGCEAVDTRLDEYVADFSQEVPDFRQAGMLSLRCLLTEELLKDNVKTCDDAKTLINDSEISSQVSESVMPLMLQSFTRDVAKGVQAQAQASQTAQTPGVSSSSDSLPDAPTPQAPAEQGFFEKLIASYKNSSAPSPTVSPPPYRGYQAPLSSPPFPNAVFPYGGSPTIGQVNPATGTPLMNSISGTAVGDKLAHYRINIYGWLNGGGNVSTSTGPGYANAPAAYPQRANNVQLDQATVYVERVPDTVQNSHFDWGFRVTGFYGLDYRFTTAKGIFSDQLLKDNHEYGADVPMAYVDLYFPVKDGLNVRIGRFISVPDIEAQLATSNYTYSHSLMYSYDAYTQTGVIATLKLNKHIIVQGGLTAGNDVAPWVKGDAQPTGVVCMGYTWADGKQNVYACDNSINSGHYAYNNMNQYNLTYYNKLSQNWHTATEGYILTEKDVPAVGGPIPTEANSNGAACPAGEIRCTATETGAVNYLERQFGPNAYLSIRNGYLNDAEGQRTGTPTLYSDHVVGVGKWFLNQRVLLRPEAGVYHAYDEPAFDNGKKKTQAMGAMDVVVTF